MLGRIARVASFERSRELHIRHRFLTGTPRHRSVLQILTQHRIISPLLHLKHRDVEGNIIGTFGLARDISELKSYQNEMTAQTIALEQSNRELEQFAYVASHDLQEPLRTIVGFCQLLEMENVATGT